MARKIKDGYLGTRVDTDYGSKVDAYVEATEMTKGDLVRDAVTEYMANHPIKKPKPAVTIKPGE